MAEDDNSAEHRAFMKAAQGVCGIGTAALDLAWVACGRCDAYWEIKLGELAGERRGDRGDSGHRSES